MYDSQLSISKTGVIKIGAVLKSGMDLDHLTLIKASSVLELQEKFQEHTIWLVGEEIHVIRRDGARLTTKWHDTGTVEDFCTMNVENLSRLAVFLETEVDQSRFDMAEFSQDEFGEGLSIGAHECGTVGCAIGWGPEAGFPPLPSEQEWWTYSERVFGLKVGSPAWDWCFDADWAQVDNTPAGAAKRIRYLITNWVPQNGLEQLAGLAPYQFAESVT